MSALTKAQEEALRWLRQRNGEGMFNLHGVLLAAGELAPFTRATWNRLRDAGLIEFFRVRPRGPSRVRIIQKESTR